MGYCDVRIDGVIKEHDLVRIKKTGIVGEVVDAHADSKGNMVYTVEYEADPWDISICEQDEIELMVRPGQNGRR